MPYTEEPTGSPAANLNKGYAGQEKTDLLNDNPIARDASGGRPMILKHMSGSRMGGSPVKQYEDKATPMEMHDGKKFEDEGFMDSHFKSGAPRK